VPNGAEGMALMPKAGHGKLSCRRNFVVKRLEKWKKVRIK
jgi:hypothetical protein